MRRRAWVTGIVATVFGSSFGVAHADPSAIVAAPGLSSTIDVSGTGPVVTTVQTPTLRDSAPVGGAGPRILVIGTGVARALFPAAIQDSIQPASGPDTVDTHGYGTLAASTIFQLLPNATVISRTVPAHDAAYDLIYMDRLAAALEDARADRTRYDLVLLAYPPQAALDPISHMIGHVDYGTTLGRGMAMVTEALLANHAPTDGPVAGIPASKALRDAIFARANLKQRDAIDRYATQALAWKRVVMAANALSDAGVAVVAPSGDYTRKSGSTILPLVPQTVFGLSALPSVITVGASYSDNGIARVSPMSGRGPTLALRAKPDLLAPADVMSMLPIGARLPWPDDSTRVPLQMLSWAKPGVAPSSCPSVTNVYRCVLQGSSMVSASVVAANLASLVATGTPNVAGARGANDDEVLRGIAWARAAAHPSVAYGATRAAFAWEEGAGALSGLRDLNLARTPVVLARAEVGEVAPNHAASVTLPLWSGGALLAGATAAVDAYVGPDLNGASIAMRFSDPARASASTAADHVTLDIAPSRTDGGVYALHIVFTLADGDTVRMPGFFVQDVPLDFHADYAYNELQTGGTEGERVEDASLVLFPGLPTNVGLIGEAFKNFSGNAFRPTGGDPLNGIVVRSATTQSTFTDPSLPPAEHGRGHMPAVPPGFYRIHLLTDHAVEATQARGRNESIGMQLATSGPEAAVSPGANLLLSAKPVCDQASDTGAPLTGCVRRDPTAGEVDSTTGLCVARNATTGVAYNYYCGELAYAVPSAVVSRAIHLIDHNDDPARSEWKTCGVNVPLDGTSIDFEGIAVKARTCGGATTPTAWTYPTKASDCLGPTEHAVFPLGNPTDVTASYSGVSAGSIATRNLPVGVMSYEFKLPYLNTYTTAGIALSYVAENAIVGVRFQTGPDNPVDSSSGLLVVDDPAVTVTPALHGAGTRGSFFTEWAVMSANASVGRVSLIVIPTAWTRPDLDPTKSIARVQVCDAALRVSTYAKQPWGTSAREGGVPTQNFPVLDRGLLAQIDPAHSRMRPAYDAASGTFADAGAEREDAQIAVQVPKNSTLDARAAHHVRSPVGGPASLKDVRRWGTDARRYESVLAAGTRAYDPEYGVTPLSCTDGNTTADPTRAAAYETCRAWNAARASEDLLAELSPQMSVNGRFAGVFSADYATLARAAGNVAFESSGADDAGASESRWARGIDGYAHRFPVGNFYDDAASPMSLSLRSGVITVTKEPKTGDPILTVRAGGAGGEEHTISTKLR